MNRIPGLGLLISSLPGSPLRMHVESLGMPRHVNKQSQSLAYSVLSAAICDLRAALCDLRSAISDLRSAICDLLSFSVFSTAICDLRSAISFFIFQYLVVLFVT